MIHSAVILCGFLLAGFAAPAMAETEQTEAMKQTVLPQEEQQMVQRLLNNTDFALDDTLSDPSGSDPENLTCSCPKLIPTGYKFLKGHGYYKFHSVPRNWYDAVAACEREGAYLVIPNSKEEANFVASPLGELKVKWDLGVYVGIHDLLDEGTFFTIFGQPLHETGYAVWAPGSPLNGTGKKDNDCIVIDKESLLNEFPCDVQRLFACELWQ